MGRQKTSDLDRQALRLSPRSLDRLKVIVHELRAHGSNTTMATAARGLCFLALSILQGAAGRKAAGAFRAAAADSTSRGTYVALKALRTIFGLDDDEPITVRRPPIIRRVRRKPKGTRSREELRAHPLYLPDRALRQLEALAKELCDAGAQATVSAVTRGLCTLALHLADDDMPYDIASIVRGVMLDPTEECARCAVEMLLPLLEEPATLRDPPLLDIELDGPPTEEMPPLFPPARAA